MPLTTVPAPNRAAVALVSDASGHDVSVFMLSAEHKVYAAEGGRCSRAINMSQSKSQPWHDLSRYGFEPSVVGGVTGRIALQLMMVKEARSCEKERHGSTMESCSKQVLFLATGRDGTLNRTVEGLLQ